MVTSFSPSRFPPRKSYSMFFSFWLLCSPWSGLGIWDQLAVHRCLFLSSPSRKVSSFFGWPQVNFFRAWSFWIQYHHDGISSRNSRAPHRPCRDRRSKRVIQICFSKSNTRLMVLVIMVLLSSYTLHNIVCLYLRNFGMCSSIAHCDGFSDLNKNCYHSSFF